MWKFQAVVPVRLPEPLRNAHERGSILDAKNAQIEIPMPSEDRLFASSLLISFRFRIQEIDHFENSYFFNSKTGTIKVLFFTKTMFYVPPPQPGKVLEGPRTGPGLIEHELMLIRTKRFLFHGVFYRRV